MNIFSFLCMESFADPKRIPQELYTVSLYVGPGIHFQLLQEV